MNQLKENDNYEIQYSIEDALTTEFLRNNVQSFHTHHGYASTKYHVHRFHILNPILLHSSQKGGHNRLVTVFPYV